MTSRKQELQAELKLLEQQEQEKNNLGHPYDIGENYFIRTVTYAALGKLTYVGDKELKLAAACWVADQGRMTESLKNGIEAQENSELEMFDQDVIIGRGAIVDATLYMHKLPTLQKG